VPGLQPGTPMNSIVWLLLFTQPLMLAAGYTAGRWTK